MDGWTDKQKCPCVLQNFFSFGAAALLPLFPIQIHAKQGSGYRWPHIALGRPVQLERDGQTMPLKESLVLD